MNETKHAMDVLTAIALRRSVREFKPDPVSEDVITALLTAAHQAASSWNLQPWEFIVVTDQHAKEALAEAVTVGNQPVVLNGGVTFVCLGSMRQQDALADRIANTPLPPDAAPERRERLVLTAAKMREDVQWRREHVLTNTYIGIAQLVLASQSLGLGSLWMGGYDEAKVKEVMGIPDDYLVASLVTVGTPAQEIIGPAVRKRRPLEEVVHRNSFGGK